MWFFISQLINYSRTSIAMENGNLSIQENFVMMSAYTYMHMHIYMYVYTDSQGGTK